MLSNSFSSRAAPESPQRARILIVDDHPMMREGLTALLSSQPDLIAYGQAANISEAMKQVNETTPDLAVVDIALNGENGLDLVRRLKSINTSIRILVLSMYDDGLYAERALDAGAMGYLNKVVIGDNILLAIRQILAGKRYLSQEIEAQLNLRESTQTPAGARHGIQSLTNRELEVFRLIGEGIATIEIAKELHLSVKTVESHRQKIKLKLGLRTSAQLSHEATHFFLENGQTGDLSPKTFSKFTMTASTSSR